MPPAVEAGGIDIEGANLVRRALEEAMAEDAADEARLEIVEFARSRMKVDSSSVAVLFVLGADTVGIVYSRGRKYGSQLRLSSSSVPFVVEIGDIEGSVAKGVPQKHRPLQ